MIPVADIPVAEVRSRGWAHVPGYVDPGKMAEIADAAGLLAASPGAHPGCLYYLDALPEGGTRLARLEGVADALPFGALLAQMAEDAAQCLGAPVVAFKDKLNIRYPRSPGYAPHQDAARWEAFGARFLSIGLFLGPSGPDRGGFEFAQGPVARQGDDLDSDQFHALSRTAVEAQPGDALFIEGMVAHRTLENTSDDRVLHLLITFATGADPDAREAYYADQRARFSDVALGNMFLFPARL